jgi:hypothetical protein
MSLTSKEQALDKAELKKLLEKKEEALTYVHNLNYEDTYKQETRKKGTADETKVNVIDTPSALRSYLEAIGVSASSKNDVISKTKKASSELANDIVVIKALVSVK